MRSYWTDGKEPGSQGAKTLSVHKMGRGALLSAARPHMTSLLDKDGTGIS